MSNSIRAVTGFVGVGDVGEDLWDIDLGDPLPAAGVGLRYNLSKENRINFRLDVAVAKDDAEVYFGVGEVF